MKRVTMILLCALALVAAYSPAFASYWYFSPNGEVDVTGQSQISFDLYFYNNSGSTFNAISWDTLIQVDTTELTPNYYYYDEDDQGYSVVMRYTDSRGRTFGNSFWYGGQLEGQVFWVAGQTLSAYVTIAQGANLMATITFDILNPDALNGIVLADLITIADTGAYGFQDNDGVRLYGDASTLNPDIGVSSVPLPGAAWLLGSGIVGLLGIRRRKARKVS